jgi:hypothetical protein
MTRADFTASRPSKGAGGGGGGVNDRVLIPRPCKRRNERREGVWPDVFKGRVCRICNGMQ